VNVPVLNKQAYDRFKDSVGKGQCLAFVGSGPSCGSYPDWPDLVSRLCEACGIPVDEALAGAPAARLQELAHDARCNSPSAYNACLHDTFGGTIVRTSRVYECLIGGPFEAYLTLNFDPVFASALRSHNHDDYRVQAFPLLNVFELRDKALFHLHGLVLPETRLEDITVVLGTQEFESAYAPNGLLEGLLNHVFTFKHVCFVGCALSEKALRELLSRCREFREDFFCALDMDSPRHHILLALPETRDLDSVSDPEERSRLKGVVEVDRQQIERVYGDMGISVLWYDPVDDDHSGLVALLEDLAAMEPVCVRTGFEGLYDE